ncbi:LmeA family phospholipid-binding protein [Aliterella atlantica]|uniref:DUF2993 domain-containing protein n=1 Tax=Aliterella atlantica CENA595 TaxID=1618023 RepID=A0A0D9A1E7_9CYAN|nr:DUF2993 domain-containing protein [Aliterella atlantica]KJH73281.1 hypothetical protein UH38_00290 [Aliterella atlantica CENA595]
MSEQQRLDEQAIAKAAEIGLASKLDAAEQIDVDVKTDLFKVVQGQADAINISGQGLVMEKDIRVQEMELHLDNIDIDPLSVLLGQIELKHPVDAIAKLVVTEQDINRALNSDYVQNQMQAIDLNVEGQIQSLKMQQMELLLPDDDKMIFSGKALVQTAGNSRQLDFSAVVRPRTSKQPVLVESFQCKNGQSISLEFAVALLGKMKEITQLSYFEIGKMAIGIKEMEVQTGKITLYTEARVKEIPL